MIEKSYIKESIIKILSDIQVNGNTNANESLFGYKNNYTSRDIAYAFIEIERVFNIPIDTLIEAIEKSKGEYTVNALIDVVSEIVGAV